MSIAQTESAVSPTAPLLAPQKYVHPRLRQQLEEERKRSEAEGGPRPQQQQQQQQSSHRPRPGAPPSGGERGTDRWKRLDEDSFRNGVGGGRRQQFYDGPQPDNQQRRYMPKGSRTGTNWDIRDGRNWVPENIDDIFKQDKDKGAGINFDKYYSIPVEISGREQQLIKPLISFRETSGVHPLLMENIIRVEYEKPTPVQEYSIPAILAGRDLMACAQTGSGKTAAFLFPIITKMLNVGPPADVKARRGAHPIALILSPTRELSMQIYAEARKYAYGTGIRTVVVYGGAEMRAQFYDLERGCDICVATPGRLSDLIKRQKIFLRLIKYFILDEADRMLDMGFSPQIYSIVTDTDMPTSEQGRQTVMFSATFPKPIQELASEFLRDNLFLTVGRVGSTNDFIEQHLLYADEDSKPKKLLKLLEEARGLVLVFVETRKKADVIEDFLIRCNLPAVTIHGEKSQYERERALAAFRRGERSILVATDVAARGLDIHNIEHVVNCDLPARIEDYVHRIGRTGRAGNRGKATSFVNEGNRGMLRELLSLLEESGQSVPDWFYQMVRQCTSAYRGGFGGGGSSFGRRFGSGGHGGSNEFGGSKFNSSYSSMSRNNSAGGYRCTESSRGAPTKPPPALQEDDDEDGW